MSMFANQIYCRNYDSDTIEEIYNDYLVICGDRFKKYIHTLNYDCLCYSYKDILEDWGRSLRCQKLKNHVKGTHYFNDYSELLAVCNYIVKVSKLHFNYSQKNSKYLYCPLKSSKKTFSFLDTIENETLKEMCIALYRGAYSWHEFLENNLK